jgi:succinyl-CoA synthetase alpha subunit
LNGTSFVDVLELFERDEETDAVLMIGEIGGEAEEAAAEWIAKNSTKPIAAYIAGMTAPAGRRMGHAGAIISGGKGSAEDKIAALRGAGAMIAEKPSDLGVAIQKALVLK